MRVYDVSLYREGRWWLVAIAELGGLTQARSLAEAAIMARGYIATWLEVAPDSFDIEIGFTDSGAVPLAGSLAELARCRRAAGGREQAEALAAKLVKELVADGVSMKDAAEVLGVSYQRARRWARRWARP
ncbi:MAG: helix-turn-helix domain-containing protein [Propionibacteriaceae bacterium]|jgi:predicted RNase H-like HicB family nuclease|nr:helix-turn-helix domain-containing protein [Propionibacteriaceae bacterium]